MSAKIDKRYHEIDTQHMQRFFKPLDLIAAYHRHEVHGLDNVPAQGRCLVVVNHSLATYDNPLLGMAIYKHAKRVMRPLSDRSLFAIPTLGRFLGQAGFVPGSPKVAEYMLQREELLMVAPGGMREALKPSTEKYTVRWDSRKGFVRLAMKMQSPIILSACPAADDMFTVYENTLTKMVYQRVRLPVAMIRGWGLSLAPRPVKLQHYLSKPIQPPKVDINDTAAFDKAVDQWHAELTQEMERMLQQHA